MGDRKEYSSFSIPRREAQTADAAAAPSRTEGLASRADSLRPASNTVSFSGAGFAEIEYDPNPRHTSASEAALRFFSSVTPPQSIEQRFLDPIRQKFYEMRGLASDRPFARDDSELFYKQAKFMEDFTDDYEGSAKLSMYYPYYQHMGYEQLRTYFTWRTKARQGEVEYTSLSYAFLYVYELLSGIGVKDPCEGLDKLVDVWDKYLKYGPALAKYMPQWFKDYHVYYKLPHSFSDFVKEHNLYEYYPEMFLFDDEAENSLEVWNRISDYSIITSKFYTAENKQLMRDCFSYVLGSFKKECMSRNISIEKLLVYQFSSARAWHPFKQALFHNWRKQPDCKVSLPGQESYTCKNNRWSARLPIYYTNQKFLAGYLIKKTEACLRQVTKYKYKLKEDPAPNYRTLGAEIDLDVVIEKAVADFHRDLTRTVVTVDHANLARIREEAQGTQEKLIVPEESVANNAERGMKNEEFGDERNAGTDDAAQFDLYPRHCAGDSIAESGDDGWTAFKDALSAIELDALAIALRGGGGIKAFADENGLMLEVLADGINEKASDYIGDSVLETDGGMLIYDEYREKVEEIINKN